jgi:hypothetical protein
MKLRRRSVGTLTLVVSSSRQTPPPAVGTIKAEQLHDGPSGPDPGRNPDMITKIRRIALLLATSAGIIAATTSTAHAVYYNINHCEPQLAESHR